MMRRFTISVLTTIAWALAWVFWVGLLAVAFDQKGTHPGATLFLMFGLPIVVMVAIQNWKKRQKGVSRHQSADERRRAVADYEEEAREREAEVLYEQIEKHLPALRRNLDRAVRLNDYGAIKQDSRAEIIDEFLSSVSFEPYEIRESGNLYDTVIHIVQYLSIVNERSGFDPTSIPTDGIQFELWVAESLNKFGWNAKATVSVGDQGVDVIGRKNGRSVAIQCKLYSTPVGNKAIQEVNSGRMYYGLDASAVISNSGYTRSAENIAKVCNVHLLNQYDIPRMYDVIFG